MLPVVAIVGRPNVGKSCLFNRILGRRAAVVDDYSGVTRDRHYKPAAWQGLNFMLVDTGGMVPSEREMLHASINHQIRIAVKEASAVILVAEAGTGITAEDQHIAKLLRKEAADKVFLVVNKVESARKRYEVDAFRKLGLGDPYPVSALHGSGVADILDAVVLHLKKSGLTERRPDAVVPQTLRLAVVGRPNAGKSSLVNKLLGVSRMIVDNVPGTTRDAIDSEMIYREKPVLLVDTAGLRKKSHVKQDLEYFFNLRAIAAIERCEVCAVMVDTAASLGVQDLRIVTKVFEQRKGIVLVWNKWDLVNKAHDTFDKMVADVKARYLELRPVPMVAISALTGQRVTRVLDEAFKIRERLAARVPAAEFEDNVFSWVRAHPHPAIPSDPVRFLGARQVNAPWPCFKIFTTNPRAVMPAYVRYLTNKIYDTYGFTGCPVTLDFRAAARSRPGHPFKPGRVGEDA